MQQLEFGKMICNHYRGSIIIGVSLIHGLLSYAQLLGIVSKSLLKIPEVGYVLRNSEYNVTRQYFNKNNYLHIITTLP